MLQNLISNKKIKSDYISDFDKEYLENNIEYCKVLFEPGREASSVTSVIKKKANCEIENQEVNSLRINSLKKAMYGNKDVTDIINKKFINGDSSLIVSKDLFDNQLLEITYSDGEVVKYPEGKKLVFENAAGSVTHNKHDSEKSILDFNKIESVERAIYGGQDVTDIINERIKRGDFFLRVHNDTFGDPDPGVFKYLEITYNGQTSKIPENEMLIFNKEMTEDDDEKEKTIVAVIFCYAINDWKERLKRRIDRIVESGLYEASDEVHLVIVDTNNQEKDINELMSNYKKIIVERHADNQPECKGMQKIDQIGKTRKNVNLFYCHVKGVFNNFKNFDTKEISERKINSVKDWIESLDYFTIDKWRECILKLNEGYETVGVTNNGGWWWGNFWWSKSSHIKKNVEYVCRDRWYAEAWLHDGNINPSGIKKYEMFHYELDPQGSDFPRFFYDGSYSFEGKKIEIVSAFFGYDGVQRDEAQHCGPENLVDVTDKIKKMIENNGEINFIADDQNLSISDPSITSLGTSNKCLILNYKLSDIPDKIFRLKTFSGWRTKLPLK
jgi:hypothetical protein